MKEQSLSMMVLPLITLFTSHVCQASYVGPLGTDRAPKQERVFPPEFHFGVATAAYQVEGSWNISGKSQSIWDVFTHTAGKIKDNSTGDDACKSYEYYQRDIQMLKFLGVDFFRMSISWTRILPNGFANEINQEGIDHYNKVIDELVCKNIDPVVTIYHWDLPQSLQNLGGWANSLVVQWVEDYARVLFENFGDRVKIWLTINEPKQVVGGYSSDKLAPGVNAHGISDYLVAKHVVLAHARIWRLYDKEFRCKQEGFVGIAMFTEYYQALTNSSEDVQAAQDTLNFKVGLYAHPIFSSTGGFPPRVVKLVAEKSKQQGYPRSRLIDFTDEEREYCKGTSDFYGLNHYTTKFVTRKGYKPTEKLPSQKDDLGVVETFLNYPKTASDQIAIIPHGIREALKWVKDTYNDPHILITENGAPSKGPIQDPDKIDYFQKYLSNVLDAIGIYVDDVSVLGYTAWSLMDDFEWVNGYTPKFGFFKVHFDDERRTREARLSALWYRDLITSKTLKPYYVPTYERVVF